MGMFDEIKCEWPLPVEGANALTYQTKDTPSQFCDLYMIRADGTLWHQDYDTEDQSVAGKWMAEHPGEALPEKMDIIENYCGCISRVNERWAQVVDFKGTVCFYGNITPGVRGRLEWAARFESGKLAAVTLVEPPQQ